MNDKHKLLLRQFESGLDAELARQAIQSYDSNEALAIACEADEYVAELSRRPDMDWVRRGMAILGPRLVSGLPGMAPKMKGMLDSLHFASHYYMMREFLYFSYNAPDSIKWKFKERLVEVRFQDPSIPRQFFTVFNEMLLLSADAFAGHDGVASEILGLLKGEPEGVVTPNVEAAFALIATEVRAKLGAYFSILPMDSTIDFGGYTYAEFIRLYTALLGKALFHRYMTRANGTRGAVFMEDAELVNDACADAALAPRVVRAILSDIVFDRSATKSKLDASHFSLYREGAGKQRIVMRPHEFSVSEGLVQILRIVAARRPHDFLRHISNELGSAFVRRIRAAWEAQGFTAHAEVSLRRFGAALPDIDLLVVCEEPTLGFVVFVCEVKSPVPPTWAKDQLRALGGGSIAKAFRQAEAIRGFLGTPDGVSFLRAMVPPEGNPHFDGFVVAIKPLIITSDNAGMFFESESTPVVSFRTLERLLRKSDGDTAYILNVIKTYNKVADGVVKTAKVEFRLGRRTVRYEGVVTSPILDFPQREWRNSAERKAMIEEFVAAGAHPFDVLPHDPREASAPK